MDQNVTDQDLLYEVTDGIGYVTFNRPQSRNALTFAMYERLAEICADVGKTSDVKVLEDFTDDRDQLEKDIRGLIIGEGQGFEIDNQDDSVKQFVLSLSADPGGSVLELNGQAVACVVPAEGQARRRS